MSTASDRMSRDFAKYQSGLDRLDSQSMQDQRYVPSSEKDDIMDKLALGAKVQRALDRRYSSQDAVYNPKPKKQRDAEKAALAAQKR